MNLDGFALPVKKLQGSDPVETLDLSCKNHGIASLVVIASLISVNGALTELSIDGNHVGDKGVGAICEAIQSNKETKLASLDMSGNRIGQVGAKSVASMVAVTGRLTSLNLSDNQLCGLDRHGRGTYTAEGIAAIADTLRVNGGLTALDLSYNGLRNEGVSAVCEAIQSNKETKLASLNMTMNRIGRVGAKSVAAMVAVTGSLTVTNLLGNQLDAASAKMLADVAEQKGISLCGIRRDQTTAKFSGHPLSYQNLKPPDAILLASDLSQAVVKGALTQVLAF